MTRPDSKDLVSNAWWASMLVIPNAANEITISDAMSTVLVDFDKLNLVINPLVLKVQSSHSHELRR